MDDDEGQEPETPGESVDDPAMAKLRKENRSLRERLRRSEIETKYGSDIAELVVETEAPLTKWETLAEKFAAKLPRTDSQEAAPDQETPVEPEAPISAAETRMAAATQTGTAASGDTERISYAEWQKIYDTQGAAAAFAIPQEQVELEPNPLPMHVRGN